MNNRKDRPQNGPGANGLRGGRKIYSGKTCLGGWLDDVGGTAGFHRGFTTDDFETECQHQQTGYGLPTRPIFGAALTSLGEKKMPAVCDLFTPEITGTPTNYTSTAKAMQMGEKIDNEIHFPVSNLRGEELETYRQSWTKESEIGRNLRYQTESRRAANDLRGNFQIKSTRLLPGTPKPLEHFRERLLERHGILSFSALRHHVGRGLITCADLRSAFSKLDVKTSRAEFSQIVAYFTSADSLNSADFIRTVVARTDGFDEAGARATFGRLAAATGAGPLGLETGSFFTQLNRTEHPEVVDGIEKYIAPYSQNEGWVREDDFLLLLSDLFAGAPSSAVFRSSIRGSILGE